MQITIVINDHIETTVTGERNWRDSFEEPSQGRQLTVSKISSNLRNKEHPELIGKKVIIPLGSIKFIIK